MKFLSSKKNTLHEYPSMINDSFFCLKGGTDKESTSVKRSPRKKFLPFTILPP